MDEEIQPGVVWRKAIPQSRDRLQSRLLVKVVGGLLLLMAAFSLILAFAGHGQLAALFSVTVAIGASFAVLVWFLKAATPAAAAWGGVICILLVFWTARSDESMARTALTPLVVLFVLTFLSTKFGRQRKAEMGLEEEKKGRSAAQVIANLSIAALCMVPLTGIALNQWLIFCCSTSLSNFFVANMMRIMCFAALAEAAADTVSSEIGQAFGGRPITLSFTRVSPGTDGAITLRGTFSGCMAAIVVAIAGGWSSHLSPPLIVTAAIAGISGMLFDSVLGSTVERRGWLGNDLVNFSSTLFAALLGAYLYRMYLVHFVS